MSLFCGLLHEIMSPPHFPLHEKGTSIISLHHVCLKTLDIRLVSPWVWVTIIWELHPLRCAWGTIWSFRSYCKVSHLTERIKAHILLGNFSQTQVSPDEISSELLRVLVTFLQTLTFCEPPLFLLFASPPCLLHGEYYWDNLPIVSLFCGLLHEIMSPPHCLFHEKGNSVITLHHVRVGTLDVGLVSPGVWVAIVQEVHPRHFTWGTIWSFHTYCKVPIFQSVPEPRCVWKILLKPRVLLASHIQTCCFDFCKHIWPFVSFLPFVSIPLPFAK